MKKRYCFILAIAAQAALLSSCSYKKVLDYPYNEIVYMPASVVAAGGVYNITPSIEGQSFRYRTDKASGKFNIPLGAIRSGVNASGDIPINIFAGADAVAKLQAAGVFKVPADPTITTELLPATAYSLPGGTTISKDSSVASFTLAVDLNFITNSATNTPKKRYALQVGITVPGKAADSLNKSVVVLIDPVALILPTANFSSYTDNAYKTAGVTNVSLNGVSYSWNFGDGTAVSTATSPKHQYTASGTYTITLTATGISGATSVKTTSITIP